MLDVADSLCDNQRCENVSAGLDSEVSKSPLISGGFSSVAVCGLLGYKFDAEWLIVVEIQSDLARRQRVK